MSPGAHGARLRRSGVRLCRDPSPSWVLSTALDGPGRISGTFANAARAPFTSLWLARRSTNYWRDFDPGSCVGWFGWRYVNSIVRLDPSADLEGIMGSRHLRAASALLGAGAILVGPAAACITRLEITSVEPAFQGRSFEPLGAYERVRGRAFGEVDPDSPANAIVQDIQLAPRNSRGLVEYSTEIDILRPSERARGNGVLFFNILNRGNKGGLAAFNANVPPNLTEINAVANPGDGFMLSEGYTLVWFGWQADVLPGNNRLTLSVPIGRHQDGSAITGPVRAELTTLTPAKTLNLSSGWFTALTHASYPTAQIDNRKAFEDGFLPSLTVRAKEQEPRVPIPNTEWTFGSCPEGGEPASDDKKICYPAGFEPGKLYELIYRAKDPLVLGLGYAAARDLAAFLKHEERDSTGTANPVYRSGAKAIVMGTSQSGRMIRSLVHLGFNQDESGRVAFEGAYPHIGGGLM